MLKFVAELNSMVAGTVSMNHVNQKENHDSITFLGCNFDRLTLGARELIGKICKSGLGVPTIDETGIGGTKNRRNRKKKMQTVAYGKKPINQLHTCFRATVPVEVPRYGRVHCY